MRRLMVQTAGEPPNQGNMNFALRSSTWNSSSEDSSTVNRNGARVLRCGAPVPADSAIGWPPDGRIFGALNHRRLQHSLGIVGSLNVDGAPHRRNIDSIGLNGGGSVDLNEPAGSSLHRQLRAAGVYALHDAADFMG
jgi:hypothetical protein